MHEAQSRQHEFEQMCMRAMLAEMKVEQLEKKIAEVLLYNEKAQQ